MIGNSFKNIIAESLDPNPGAATPRFRVFASAAFAALNYFDGKWKWKWAVAVLRPFRSSEAAGGQTSSLSHHEARQSGSSPPSAVQFLSSQSSPNQIVSAKQIPSASLFVFVIILDRRRSGPIIHSDENATGWRLRPANLPLCY